MTDIITRNEGKDTQEAAIYFCILIFINFT
jgi:hypothetical protein